MLSPSAHPPNRVDCKKRYVYGMVCFLRQKVAMLHICNNVLIMFVFSLKLEMDPKRFYGRAIPCDSEDSELSGSDDDPECKCFRFIVCAVCCMVEFRIFFMIVCAYARGCPASLRLHPYVCAPAF